MRSILGPESVSITTTHSMRDVSESFRCDVPIKSSLPNSIHSACFELMATPAKDVTKYCNFVHSPRPENLSRTVDHGFMFGTLRSPWDKSSEAMPSVEILRQLRFVASSLYLQLERCRKVRHRRREEWQRVAEAKASRTESL
jgi:hypothetical protein